MNPNWVRNKLNSGEPTIGCFLGLGSPHVAELLARAGYDWLVLEMEHCAVDMPQIELMLMATSGTQVIPIVRVPTGQPIEIQRALDAGGMGVLVPMVKTAAQVRSIVDSTRYPPAGKRGFGPLRAGAYSQANHEYFQQANENIIVAMILETKEAVDNIDEIAAVPGLDAIVVGAFDLCLSLGLDPFKMPHSQVEDILQTLLVVGRSRRVAIGMGCVRADELVERIRQGFTCVWYGTDYGLLAAAAEAGLAAFRRECPAGSEPVGNSH